MWLHVPVFTQVKHKHVALVISCQKIVPIAVKCCVHKPHWTSTRNGAGRRVTDIYHQTKKEKTKTHLKKSTSMCIYLQLNMPMLSHLVKLEILLTNGNMFVSRIAKYLFYNKVQKDI